MARRRIMALAAALVISLALAAPASAGKPIRGCSDSFNLWDVLAFRAYLNSPGFYASLSSEGAGPRSGHPRRRQQRRLAGGHRLNRQER